MYIQLMHRHFGLHEPIKHMEIKCDFEDVYISENNIKEDVLLDNIPDGFLPVDASKILLTVSDKYGSTGQYGLKRFRSWAKYFDSYVLELHKEPLDWWGESDHSKSIDYTKAIYEEVWNGVFE